MARSSEVFTSPHMNQLDDRKNYGETRIITFGHLYHLPIVLVWTYRGNSKRIISLRRANEREIKKYVERLG
ncbi:BrnT family toxin [Polynucleobacter sp. MWH-UH23A]|uniref:BrnT family toxin n=1 Tax=Polynucleobacter sp. MWH-UH23A TaxID=1855613 RepID=UPI003364F922